MAGDYSHRIFRKNKNYSGVLMQQGRVQLDADSNEQLDIQLYRTETESIDVIGRCGVPRKNGGFEIGASPGGQDLRISAGRIYVDGLMCELHEPSTYTTQPYLPNPDHTSLITSPPTSPPGPTRRLNLPDGRYVVFLDAWQRELTALDDPLIREVALGGPDTTTRLQNVWQVKLQPVNVTSPPVSPPADGFTCRTQFPEFQQMTAPSTGTLNAQTSPPKPEEDPCLLPPTSGYSGLENQLYRIEIQRGGTLTGAGGPVNFKWSRDNASVETTVVSIADFVATVKDTGKDQSLGFGNNQWVELVNDESTLKATPRTLVQIDKVDPATHEITFKTSLASFANLIPGLKLRRWDQTTNADQNGLQATAGVWIDIEAGVQVRFSTGTYRAGDYWLIPARTTTREIEWPPFKIPNTQPVPQLPQGIRHHFCRLALVEVNAGVITLKDCRPTFPPLTQLLNFFHVGGSGQEAEPGTRLPCPLEVGVTNGHIPVEGALVRFTVPPVAGVLHSDTGSGATVIVETGADGVARCAWELGPAQRRLRCLQVEASLLNENGQSLAPALHFNASFGAGAAEERGITVRQIITLADNDVLQNDTLVAIQRLLRGIRIVCDQTIDPNTVGASPLPPGVFPEDRIAGKPTCFITLDLPYPLGNDVNFWDLSEIFGFQPLILGGHARVNERNIDWIPSAAAIRFLTIVIRRLQRAQITDRVLAHLTLKGNFIFARGNPELNLDGDVFGRPASDRIDIELPSGDNRRGGDLDMWFWLEEVGIVDPTPPGLNLSVTVVPGPVGGVASTIRGTVLDAAGAAMAGAVVTLSGPLTRTATTTAAGAFNFPNLPRGTYKVSVQIGALSAEQTVTIT